MSVCQRCGSHHHDRARRFPALPTAEQVDRFIQTQVSTASK
ncbi:MAG: hypothetical protein WBW48_20740 [Anaerolineae bacterium]